MNGKHVIDAKELHQLLTGTQNEEFDVVEETFNLCLGDSAQKYLTIYTLSIYRLILFLQLINSQYSSI